MFVTPSFEILPAEMLYIICRRVLLSDTKGTRLARAARIFTPFVKEASADLTRTPVRVVDRGAASAPARLARGGALLCTP